MNDSLYNFAAVIARIGRFRVCLDVARGSTGSASLSRLERIVSQRALR